MSRHLQALGAFPLFAILLVVALGCGGPRSSEEIGAVSQAISCPPTTAPGWAAGVSYSVGNYVTFGGIIYRCIQAHRSQTGWEPPGNYSLWQRPTPCTVQEWATQTAYVVGSEVTYNGKRYTCLQAHTSVPGWEPTVAASLWKVVQETCTDGKETLPSDLSVQYISRTPRFAQLKINYSPDGYNPTIAPESAGKQWPDVGETTTFTARVRNLGAAATPTVGYRWLIDGSVRAEGQVPALAANATADVSMTWPWQDNDHTVRLQLYSLKCAGLNDGHAVNDAREQRTNALLLTAYVWENFADWMAGRDNTVGTRSAEDWIQYHADQMNGLFTSHTSNLAPQGVKLRLAVDRVIRVPSNTTDPGGTHTPEACPTDGCWGFGGPDPNQWIGWMSGVVNGRDDALLHEWGHQLGLIDLYLFDVQNYDVRINDGEPGARSFSSSSAKDNLDRLFQAGNTVDQGLIPTYEGRPVWFALTFPEARTLSRMRMRFSPFMNHHWQVYSADSLEPAVAKVPPAVARTPVVETLGGEFAEVSFPAASAKVWLVHVERIDSDKMTHVSGWQLFNGTSQVDVLGLLTSARVAGTPLMPIIANGDTIRWNSVGNELMNVIAFNFSPYHARALNLDADWMNRGLPLRRGYFGKYLFEIPGQNALIVKQAGQPLSGAKVEVFQLQDNVIPDVVKFVGTTDATGRFQFPSQTTTEYAERFDRSEPITVQNPFSTVFSSNPHVVGTNGVLAIRVTHSNGLRAYRFLDLAQFNLVVAQGQQEGVFTFDL
jgi:chitodextrinase